MKDLSSRRDSFRFGPGADYAGDHFRLWSSHDEPRKSYDVLLFADSRGSAVEGDGPGWAESVVAAADRRGLSCLALCRPKELTVIFSLLNFLALNAVEARALVTNIGFVDFTPKKMDYVQDILAQAPAEFRKPPKPLCRFTLDSGREEILHAADFTGVAAFAARALEKIEKVFLVGTIEFSAALSTPRTRPPAFYAQLPVGNAFLRDIASAARNVRYVDCRPEDADLASLTTDAVHLTPKGHDLVLRRLAAAGGIA